MFYAFGFSLAENLSAKCMGYLGATLMLVFVHARGRSERVTQRRHNRNPRWETGKGVRMTSRTGSVWRILGDLKKSVSWVENCTPNEKGQLSGLAEARRICVLRASHEMGGRWKSQNRKNVNLSPYVELPLNSKVIKSFLPELRSRKCFSCFQIPMFYVYMLWTVYVRFAYSCMDMLYNPPKLGKGTGRLKNRKTRGKRPVYRIIDIKQNTK